MTHIPTKLYQFLSSSFSAFQYPGTERERLFMHDSSLVHRLNMLATCRINRLD